MCLSLISCTKQNSGPQAKLFYAYSTENLMADWNYFDEENEENEIFLDRDYTLRYNGLKNENIAMQLMIHANEYISSFDFVAPDVKNENGDVIPSTMFSVGAEWYQDVTISKEIDAYSGLYPDAIIPMENYKFRRMDHIQKDRNQGIWISLDTTNEVKAGKYTGNGTLKLDEKEYSIPFEVTIYDAEMPVENHLKTGFLIWYQEIINGEGNNDSPELHKAYYDFLVNKRISPGEMPDQYYTSAQVFAESAAELVGDPRVSGLRLPGGVAANFSISKAREYLKALVNKNVSLRKAGNNVDLLKKCYFYIDDEPTPNQYERVKTHDKEVYDLKQELLPLVADYPDLQESLLKINNLVTVQYNDQLVGTPEEGGVQTWCPQAHNFQTVSSRNTYKERMEYNGRPGGEGVFWYVCEAPNNPYPNYHLDGNLLFTRTFKYMQYAYGIQGEIHWNICNYSKTTNSFVTGRDIWYDPLTWEKCNGDGFLVYPGKEYGINGPITTLRLESIMNANEDYEYQWMINEKVQEYNAAHSTNYVTTELLQSFYSKLFKDMKTTCDSVVFEEQHNQLLSLVETLYTNLDAGMAKLIK